MNFSLTILGVNGAAPAHGRFPTSQFLQIQNFHFLIDCGEGAQMRLSDYSLPHQKINQIFISHLHGDHVFGLPGLIFSFALNDRTKPLEIFSPAGLEEMIMAQLNPGGELPFPLHFHTFRADASELIFENKTLTVNTVPLRHRIPTCGFVFREKQFQKSIDPACIQRFGLDISQIKLVKLGQNLILPGHGTVSNSELTLPDWSPRAYAFITDTIFDKTILPHIKAVDLLYHEATFCEDFSENASRTMHSTAAQAAKIAKAAQVGRLILGHYSSRYKDLQPFLDEARPIFPNTELGLEGNFYEVKRKKVQLDAG